MNTSTFGSGDTYGLEVNRGNGTMRALKVIRDSNRNVTGYTLMCVLPLNVKDFGLLETEFVALEREFALRGRTLTTEEAEDVLRAEKFGRALIG